MAKNPENSINLEQELSERPPIEETDTTVSYLGITLEKATAPRSGFVPDKEVMESFYVNDKFSLEMQQKIAVAMKLGQNLLIEGGTAIGKTTTVAKMCAELGYELHYVNLNGQTDVENLMGRYIPNIKRKKTTNPEYEFADGSVTSGLRQQEGKIKVIVLDEVNATNPGVLKRLNEVLNAVEQSGSVVLTEDASEQVQVNKETTKVIALMNPSGQGYLGVNPLSKELINRFVYQKEVSELPRESFRFRREAKRGIGPKTQPVEAGQFIETLPDGLTMEQYNEIPGINDIERLYEEFHFGAKEMLKNRHIAADQTQDFLFDDQRESDRVTAFVQRFYSGDINETFQGALRYYYANKLENAADRKTLEELIMKVHYAPPKVESKRKGLDREKGEDKEKQAFIAEIEALKAEIDESGKSPTPEGRESALELIEFAKEKLGKDFFGPEAVKTAFGIEFAKGIIPEIPYSKEQIEQAKKLGEMLVLQAESDNEGNPLTMERILQMAPLVKDPESGKDVKLLYSQKKAGDTALKDDCWYKNEEFLKNLPPKLRWRLVGKCPLPETVTESYGGKAKEATDYIDQTKALRDHLEIIGSLSEDEKEECSDAKLSEIRRVMESDWKQAAKILSELKVNQNHRRIPAETLYDIVLALKNNNERLLKTTYDWSPVLSSDGFLVSVGGADETGAYVHRYGPGNRIASLGVVSLR